MSEYDFYLNLNEVIYNLILYNLVLMEVYYMKWCIAVLLSITLVSSFSFGFGIPTGGGEKFDTAKFDDFLAKFEALKTKIDELNLKLNDVKKIINEIGSAHNIQDLVGTIAGQGGLKDKLTPEEKAKLQEALEEIKNMPAEYQEMIKDLTSYLEEIPGLIQDLATQITNNPMSAGNLKDLKGKLEEAQNKMNDIKGLIDTNIELAKELLSALPSLI